MMRKIRNKVRRWWHLFQHHFYRLCGRNHKCECGHKARWATLVKSQDGTEVLYVVRDKKYCPDCFLEKVIKCWRCGKEIFPGSYITLTFMDYYPNPPAYAVTHTEREGSLPRLVGCVRQTCTEFGAVDASGIWEMPGTVSPWRI